MVDSVFAKKGVNLSLFHEKGTGYIAIGEKNNPFIVNSGQRY